MSSSFNIVTGAPGTGKSAVVDEIICRDNPDLLIYDIDWLAKVASDLAGKSIIFDESTWVPYRSLWIEIMEMSAKNHKRAILFASINKSDIQILGENIASRTEWCLLDCDDQTRKMRLEVRKGWSEEQTEEAFVDAAELRAENKTIIDTGMNTVKEVADKVIQWVDQIRTNNIFE